MARCELLEGCIFFDDKMQNYPFAAEQMKQTYCVEGEVDCARFIVRDALGKERVPGVCSPTMWRGPTASWPATIRARRPSDRRPRSEERRLDRDGRGVARTLSELRPPWRAPLSPGLSTPRSAKQRVPALRGAAWPEIGQLARGP